MDKKKLSHSSLQSSVTSVLAALLCILIGLIVGFLVLLAINPAHAWGDGFVRILKGGFHDAPYGVGKELANAAPLVMTGLSVAFAFKTGLFNIGAAGQYTLGAYGALYCAIMLKMPWFVCLLAATLLGGIWGAIPGFFKAYFNINEVITSIMFNWIGLYLVNELVYQNGTGPMYDVRNTRTLNLSKNPAFAQSIIPDFGLNKMFQTNSTTIAIFLAAAVAILHGHCRCAGRLWCRPVLPVQRVPVEPAELHQPAGHGLQRHFRCSAGKLQPHRHHLLGTVHLAHLGGRLVPVHQVLPHGDLGPDQRYHHLSVRILHAVPRQDPRPAVQECRQDQCERRARSGQDRNQEGGQVICCF